MRYQVKGTEIRSENAAKPRSQASQYLEQQLNRLEPVDSGLDYGCGKLRYFPTLRRVCRGLTVVDSAVQLDRIQVVGGRRTTIRRYISRWSAVRALDLVDFATDRCSFDFALCSNVLSAIPSYKVRLAAVSGLARRLRKGGRALFAVQYRNSHYSALRDRPNAQPYLDGHLVRTRQGSHFYGVIRPERLARLLRKGGFEVQELWSRGESAYAWAAPSMW
jgi:SAM-dependent methyltransferase